MTVSGVTALPLVGGHQALDLVNTVEPRLPVAGQHEHLAEPADLLLWAQYAGLIDAAEVAAVDGAWAASPAASHAALAATKEIREALSAVLQAPLDRGSSSGSGTGLGSRAGLATGAAADPAETAALEYLWLRWAAAAARSTLVPGAGPGAAAQLIVGSAPALLIPDRAVHAAVNLLGTADLRPARHVPGRAARLRLAVSRPQPERLAPLVHHGRLRRLRQGPAAHRPSAHRPRSSVRSNEGSDPSAA